MAGPFLGAIMKITTLTCIVLVAATISGCETFDPTLKGLIKIEVKDETPSNRAIASDTSSSEEECTVLPVRKSVLDVDTLYGRAMARFNFKSPEQLAREYQRFIDRGYRHEKQQGAFYHLSQLVSSGTPGRSPFFWLDLTLSKNGQGSDVTAKYCIYPKIPEPLSRGARRELIQRIETMFVK